MNKETPDGKAATKKMIKPIVNIRRPAAPVEPITGVVHPMGAIPMREDVRHIEIDQIRPDPTQPRRYFNQATLDELAASIREKGVLQPIAVKISDHGDGFDIVYGERRWKSAAIAGLTTIPCIVKDSVKDAHEIQLIENIQRENLTPDDLARAVGRGLSDRQCSHEEYAKLIGKNRPFISKCVKITQFLNADGVQDRLNDLRASVEFDIGFERMYEAACKATTADGISYLQMVGQHRLTTTATRSKNNAQPRLWDDGKLVKHLRGLRNKMDFSALQSVTLKGEKKPVLEEIDKTIGSLKNAIESLAALKNKLK
jgi:ParB/RepB/Spo0J family partition protein